jgi:hypothetical protein
LHRHCRADLAAALEVVRALATALPFLEELASTDPYGTVIPHGTVQRLRQVLQNFEALP